MDHPCPDYERKLSQGRPVIGIDEVGRGPLAGPVVAAAAYLGDAQIEGLRDSKKLSEKKREALAPIILREAKVGIGRVSADEIDSLGIEPATKLAMRRAVEALGPLEGIDAPLAIVDGNRPPDLGALDVLTEVKADTSCPSVSAASIVAKVERDREMKELAQTFDAYGWHTNKGYGSKAHRDAIVEAGVTPHHRRSFLRNIAC
ncbi:ribonuclease HII [Parvularcula sp. ZS-1/3]|uniref:Ribonuclease HII n=1 Tax=Parvularcula mediterranea TaxID=2732508 RepID=A0A7Y3RJB7_9PROT|nr:ribonuclease HII [Parvularcula mediterranea]NNU15124.1 ribonuclease HII [Parvularcula mediterranea]